MALYPQKDCLIIVLRKEDFELIWTCLLRGTLAMFRGSLIGFYSQGHLWKVKI